MAHTPGPWEVFGKPHVMPAGEVLGQSFPEHHWTEWGVRTAWVHGQAKGKVPVVGIGSSRDGPVLWLSEPDARLIAAAPALLEALKLALPYVEDASDSASPADQEIIRAAIQSATGEG